MRRLATLCLAAGWAMAAIGPVAAGDRIHVDRFEVSTAGYDATLDGLIDHHRDGDAIGPVAVACDQTHQGQLVSTPGWDHVYEDKPQGLDATADGLVTYTPSCDGPETETLVVGLASGEVVTDPVSVHYDIDTVPEPELLGLDDNNDGSVDNPVVNGGFENSLDTACGDTEQFWIIADAASFSLTGAPEGMSVDGNQVTYHVPPCEAPYTDSAGINAHHEDKTDSATLDINVGVTGEAPVIEGLNYTFNDDTLVDNFVDAGALEAPVESVCRRERKVQIVGEADSYELLNAPEWITLEDDIITYDAPPDDEACNQENGIESTVTIRAYRDGQLKDVTMTNYAMNARINCVTHFTQTSGGTVITDEHCDTNGSGSIDGIIELSYDNFFHEIHITPRPDVELFTPSENYSFEGENFPSFMGFDTSDGIIHASPGAGQEGNLYFTSVRAKNVGVPTSWKNIKFEVVE